MTGGATPGFSPPSWTGPLTTHWGATPCIKIVRTNGLGLSILRGAALVPEVVMNTAPKRRRSEIRQVTETPDRLTVVEVMHEMEREAAIRLLRALVAAGLRQRESIANAANRSVAGQAGLDEFGAAHRYAREQGWLVEAGKAFSTMRDSSRLEGREVVLFLRGRPHGAEACLSSFTFPP